MAIWYSDPAVTSLEEMLPALVNPEKELNTPDEVRTGVQNILAEMMSETALIRAGVRAVLWETGKITGTKSDKLPEGQGLEYKDYFEFSEAARQIPPHRILALNRGEKEHAVKVRLEWNADAVKENALISLSEQLLKDAGHMPAPRTPSTPAPAPETAAPPTESAPSASFGYVTVAGAENYQPFPSSVPTPAPAEPAAAAPPTAPEPAAPLGLVPTAPAEALTLHGESLAGGEFKSPHTAFLRAVLDDALNRLLLPSLEREIRRELTDEAEAHAVAVFGRNLRSLLLQPPLRGKRVLAIDPGFRTGCKIAALDEYGNLLEHGVIHPHILQGRKPKDRPKDSAAPSAQPVTAPSSETSTLPVDSVPVAESPAVNTQGMAAASPEEAIPQTMPGASNTSESPPAPETSVPPSAPVTSESPTSDVPPAAPRQPKTRPRRRRQQRPLNRRPRLRRLRRSTRRGSQGTVVRTGE